MFGINTTKLAGPPSKGFAGKGFLILNVLRVCNIIALLTVVAASWIMLVMTVKTSSFFFFDGVSHFITSSMSIFLIVSELSLFRAYFARSWPLLSLTHGFVFLGMSMLILGFNILGNLNKAATSVSTLGLPMWRVVIASGILSSLFGILNILSSYIFSNALQTAREVRKDGACIDASASGDLNRSASVSSYSSRRELKLPTYQTASPAAAPQNRQSRMLNRFSKMGFKFPIAISKPMPTSDEHEEQHEHNEDVEKWAQHSARSSPVVPGIERPPTAMHPVWKNGAADDGDFLRPAMPPAPASSRYSEVSHLNRWSGTTGMPGRF